jgi:hypothetical protein
MSLFTDLIVSPCQWETIGRLPMYKIGTRLRHDLERRPGILDIRKGQFRTSQSTNLLASEDHPGFHRLAARGSNRKGQAITPRPIPRTIPGLHPPGVDACRQGRRVRDPTPGPIAIGLCRRIPLLNHWRARRPIDPQIIPRRTGILVLPGPGRRIRAAAGDR